MGRILINTPALDHLLAGDVAIRKIVVVTGLTVIPGSVVLMASPAFFHGHDPGNDRPWLTLSWHISVTFQTIDLAIGHMSTV